MAHRRRSTPSQKHVAQWFSHLALLVRAGLPITTALSLSSTHTRSSTLSQSTEDIRRSVLDGHSLATSMAFHPSIFSRTALAVVSAGERTGTLDQALILISEELEAAHALRLRLLRAALYPALVLLTLIAVTAFLLVWVIPSFEELFSESAIPLPFLTVAVIAFSHWLLHYGGYVLAGLLSVVGALGTGMSRSPRLRERVYTFSYALPLLGRTLRTRNTAQCLTLLGCLVRAGISVTSSIQMLAESPHNPVVARELARIHNDLYNGLGLAQSFEQSKIFSHITTHMIQIGESTGHLDEMLLRAGTICRDELHSSIEAMKQLAEPCLVLTVGAIVCILVVAMYLPIFQIGALSGVGQ